ncbi:MAG: stage 0 sporulation family protein [Selenomonadaceae bacterium]|nr:stage 0 sporulation family protein [Selenomonadaceae bacterium]
MQVIGVRFKKAGKIYFYEPTEEDIAKGDWVIVESPRGLECAQVVVAPRELVRPENSTEDEETDTPIVKIFRKATDEDLRQMEENHLDEKRAFDICAQKILEHNLPMKLINVEFTFDVNKMIFFFTADGRVDFRELVRDLAAVFRTRIELRQVGVRDEAKLIGGMGGCGRPLCCATFLGDFIPVSIRMAKDQNLALNPTKISGVCGRLMCCLKFENDLYCENCHAPTVSYKPNQGDRVVTQDGEGKVVSVSFSRRNATILLDTSKTVVIGWEDLIPVNNEENTNIEEPTNIAEENDKPEEQQSKRPAQEKNSRKTDGFNKYYNRNNHADSVDADTKPDRPPRQRDKTRRPSKRNPR